MGSIYCLELKSLLKIKLYYFGISDVRNGKQDFDFKFTLNV